MTAAIALRRTTSLSLEAESLLFLLPAYEPRVRIDPADDLSGSNVFGKTFVGGFLAPRLQNAGYMSRSMHAD